MIKTLIYKAGDKTVAVLIGGDREVNETKLGRALAGAAIALASEKTIEELTGGPRGFSGPVGLKGIKILADLSVRNIHNGVSGANKKDYHLKNINPGRDFSVDEFLDLSYPQEGDGCPRCQEGRLLIERGLELGHIFKLGTRYSESLGAKFLDNSGVERHAIMGCYGIGVTRSLASIVEQNNDEDGIIWPLEVAPFTILILLTDVSNKTLAETGEKLYQDLRQNGYSVLLDDRPLRPGAKFKDADLIGIPLRITIGQKFIESGKIELRWRREKKILPLTPAELLTYREKLIK
jgi:prolyl-tRNA synthetase